MGSFAPGKMGGLKPERFPGNTARGSLVRLGRLALRSGHAVRQWKVTARGQWCVSGLAPASFSCWKTRPRQTWIQQCPSSRAWSRGTMRQAFLAPDTLQR